jgi:SulP family sulfate permease
VIGRLGGEGGSIAALSLARFASVRELGASDLQLIGGTALTLSVLLSIDTLKTCVVVDAMTRTRHDSNREMVGQGLANIGSALIGGLPGSGTSGPTLVNVASGGKTKLSSVLEGGLSLLAFLALGPLLAWAPLAALAGILVVVAYRMFDWGSFRLLKQRSTVLDFLVIATVIATAVGVGLITASAVGIALAIVLFLREEVRGTVVHRKLEGNRVFSRQRRLPEEMAVLERKGAQTVVYELEGNLFFGTTDQLLTRLWPDLERRRFVILDLRQVRSVDFTAIHMLEQLEAQLSERGSHLLFSNLPKTLPAGRDLRSYFDEVGLVKPTSDIRIFNQLSDALEWAEDAILASEGMGKRGEEPPIALEAVDFVQGRKEETLQALAAAVVERSVAEGEAVFRQGEGSDDIFLIRRGRVKVFVGLDGGGRLHIATFARGDFFGDMAFLDGGVRSADAIAAAPTDLFAISRHKLDEVVAKHPRLGYHLFASLARALAIRLRRADAEIRALEET